MQVGVDNQNKLLAMAVIDYIRQYTLDKKMETWVKGSGILGGNGKVSCDHARARSLWARREDTTTRPSRLQPACLFIAVARAFAQEPTIISPRDYRIRFRRAVLSYFTRVPSSAPLRDLPVPDDMVQD